MGKPPMTADQALLYLTDRAQSKGNELSSWQGYAIEQNGNVIGEVGLYLQPDGKEADLGFALHPDFQGQGFATEASRALIHHGFKVLQLQTITAHTNTQNTKSASVMDRLEMRQEASDEGFTYTLTSGEWTARQPQ